MTTFHKVRLNTGSDFSNPEQEEIFKTRNWLRVLKIKAIPSLIHNPSKEAILAQFTGHQKSIYLFNLRA